MTKQEYLMQNLAGFENDIFAKAKFRELIKDKKVEVFIETGTYLGSTTKHLAQWCEQVFTIEINPINFAKAEEALKDIHNISMNLGSSEKILEILLSDGKFDNKVTAYLLDAHWMEYNPLIDELNVMVKYNQKPAFIAIHDFKVPNHPELGYDSYRGQDYDLDWIKESIDKIYGEDGYTVEYNSEATGARRGIIYLQPK